MSSKWTCAEATRAVGSIKDESGPHSNTKRKPQKHWLTTMIVLRSVEKNRYRETKMFG
jgi:hypothetical protein